MSQSVPQNVSHLIHTNLSKKYPLMDQLGFTPRAIENILEKAKVNLTRKDHLEKTLNLLESKIVQTVEQYKKERQIETTIRRPIHPSAATQKPFQHLIPGPAKELFKDTNHQKLIIEPSSNEGNPVQNQNIYSKNQFVENFTNKQASWEQLKNMPLGKVSEILGRQGDPNYQPNNTDQFILMAGQRNMFSQEKDEKFYYVAIDSKDRDVTQFPTSNEYVIQFSPPGYTSAESKGGYIDRLMNNITSIELVKCMMSVVDGEDAQPYYLLEIKELKDGFEGTNQDLSKSSFILDDYESKDGFRKYYFNSPQELKFNPRITLNKMTITFKHPDGTVHSFGTESAGVTKNFMVFKVTTIQRNLNTNYLDRTDG